MRKILKVFKSLPKEVLMLLAMAGLGTPIGIIYILQRWIFPGTPLFVVILYVIGAVVVICVIGFLITLLFNRGAKKRSKRMAAELAGGAESGPVSMDVRAAIKENNDRFFAAIKDMRKLGISVYELPWYVVLGDSGCGKTRLVNEGGLTFSTGKPEGYQLGTLNYNWWFTEDAIFVDMAGRLCNPKEDSDYREWEAFLNTVKKGRKGFPINGVIACVSADHLLQDAPEKLEQDANTMLERLRDLQGKLGVTFATYLVITKCDKILGFMQFFDRAERDITIKNQIFGWSRPGDFKQLHDPEKFRDDFEILYGRLNELRLRRLNDDAEEIDLGLAYSFPEEFRGMLEPLQIYVRTLFPAIKHPRAIKNLIFRGIYFTSATQEGSLILKHLAERLGTEAADQFAPLDLYPNKRPHFIKDVFFRKVFPEHGLVFRNEEQAERNRKLARLLNVGAGALAVVLIALLFWSGSTFSKLIGAPRTNAQESTQLARVSDPPSALRLADDIDEDADRLQANMLPARVLSLGVGSTKPIEYLQDIQLSLYEQRVLGQALADIDAALATIDLGSLRTGPEGEQRAAKYLDALEQYIMWYGCSGELSPPSTLTLDGLRTLCGVVEDERSIIRQEAFDEQSAEYFQAVGAAEWDGNPAHLLIEGDIRPSETILTAIGHVHGYMTRFASLNKDHPNASIKEWMRIQAQCAVMQAQYGRMLDKAGAEIRTVGDVEELRREIIENFRSFDEAFAGTRWSDGGGQYFRVASIRDAILAQRGLWRAYEQRLREGFAACSGADDADVLAAIASLSSGSTALNRPGLDQILWDHLKTSGLTEFDYRSGNYEPEQFAQLVQEVYEAFAHIIRHIPGEGAEADQIEPTDDAIYVRSKLKEIRDTMAAFDIGSGDTSTQTMNQWIEMAERHLDARDERTEATGIRDDFDATGRWRRAELEQLYGSYEDIIRRGNATRLLNAIRARLDDVGDWGLAEVAGADPLWCSEQSSEYRMEIPPCGAAVERRPERAPREEQEDRSTRRGRRGRGRRSGPATPTEPSGRGARRATTRTVIPRAAQQDFLNILVYDQWDVLQADLKEFYDRDFLESGEGGSLSDLCAERIDEAGRRYFETYVRSWSGAYADKRIASIDSLLKGTDSWRSLGRKRSVRANIDSELGEALTDILGALPFWSAYEESAGRWALEQAGSFYDGLMTEAIEEAWGDDLGSFVYSRTLPAEFMDGEWFLDDPATMVAGQFVTRWNNLLDAVESNADFRTRWNRAKDSRTLTVGATQIPWGDIQQLREQTGLTQEKLTQQLVDFERHAKNLLSVELTDILDQIQGSYFTDVDSDDGWPLVRRARDGARTVDLEDFVDFLVEVGRAEREFSMLERGFEDDLTPARDRFYRACREWRAFLGIGDDGRPSPLGVTVWGGDPLGEPRFKARGVQDTSQQYYSTVELYLGDLSWRPEQGGGTQQGPLRRATTVEGRATRYHTEWDWSQLGDRKQIVRLREGGHVGRTDRTYQPIEKELGRISPLALCAYLTDFGHADADRQVWKTLHTFEVETSPARQIVVGEMFILKLDRPMPEPIRRLEIPQGRR